MLKKAQWKMNNELGFERLIGLISVNKTEKRKRGQYVGQEKQEPTGHEENRSRWSLVLFVKPVAQFNIPCVFPVLAGVAQRIEHQTGK